MHIFTKGLLPKPNLPSRLAKHAQWLSGEGAGSWFVLEHLDENLFKLSRYSPCGDYECESLFKKPSFIFNINEEYKITFPSHCSKLSVIQNSQFISFKSIKF